MGITLFYAPGACSLAPHVALAWIGEPFEAVRVQYGSPELLKVNSAGSVPAIDTGEGWTLTQAGAILQYLARRFPQAGLAPDHDLRAEAEFDRWSAFFTGDLHPSFFPVFSPGKYTKSRELAAQAQVREAALDLIRKRLALLDAHLQDRSFIAGERRSVLDAYALPMLRWAVAKVPGGLEHYPEVAAQLARTLSDTFVHQVIAAEEGTESTTHDR